MLRLFLCGISLVFVTACAETAMRSEPLSGPAAINATAIAARQTANAAQVLAQDTGNIANSVETKQTAVRQVTLDALSVEQARAAIERANAEGTATATRVFATEEAQRVRETATATAAAGQEMQRTAATALARQNEYAATQEAKHFATATAIAYMPTAEYFAEIADRAKRERQRDEEIELAKAQNQAQIEKDAAWLATAIGILWMPFTGVCIITLFIVLLWRLGDVFILHRRALALEIAARAMQPVYDEYKNVIGYMIPRRSGGLDVQIIEPRSGLLPAPEQDLVEDVSPPIISNAKADDGKFNPNFIPPEAIREFVETLVAKWDELGAPLPKTWSQTEWLGVRLAGTYKMSNDTQDEQGNRVPGGYSKMLALFTHKRLIIDRKRGKGGLWNPNAPTDAERILQIIHGEAPTPSLPTLPQEAEIR